MPQRYWMKFGTEADFVIWDDHESRVVGRGVNKRDIMRKVQDLNTKQIAAEARRAMADKPLP